MWPPESLTTTVLQTAIRKGTHYLVRNAGFEPAMRFRASFTDWWPSTVPYSPSCYAASSKLRLFNPTPHLFTTIRLDDMRVGPSIVRLRTRRALRTVRRLFVFLVAMVASSIFGGSGRNRTYDTLGFNQLLYP